MTQMVTIIRKEFVAEVRFSRPPHNFASAEMIRQISDCLHEIDHDPAIRCSVLIGEGKSFCAGADLVGDPGMAESGGMDAIGDLYTQAERLYRRKKPMIAVVQGAAVGAGLGLALAADFRVASPRARFAANFVRLGFHPGFGLTFTLPRLIGLQKASRMLLTAERVKPEPALDWGLVDQIAPEGEAINEAHRLAWGIASNAPLSLASVRSALQGSAGDELSAAMKREHAQQAVLRETNDYKEGVASVFERREANFTGH